MDEWVQAKLRKDGEQLVLELFKSGKPGQSFGCVTLLVGNLGGLATGKRTPIRVQMWEEPNDSTP